MRWEEERKRRILSRIFTKKTIAVALIIVLVSTGIVIATTTVAVDVGYVAVVVDPFAKRMWTVGDGTYAAIHFFAKPPWAYVKRIYVAVDKLEMWTESGNRTGDYPAISCLTKDGLAVEVDILVRWRIDPGRVLDLYKNYPMLNWKMTTIASIIREVVRNLIVNYTAIETIEKRAEISTLLFEELNKAFQQDVTLANAIILQEADLREIALPKRFTDAIEEKLAAEQMGLWFHAPA